MGGIRSPDNGAGYGRKMIQAAGFFVVLLASFFFGLADGKTVEAGNDAPPIAAGETDWLPFLAGNGFYGYADRQGGIMLPPRFHDACPFINGRAAASAGKENAWGLIDASGAWVVEPHYRWVRNTPREAVAGSYRKGFRIPLGGGGFILPGRLDIIKSSITEYRILPDNSLEKIIEGESQGTGKETLPLPEKLYAAAIVHKLKILRFTPYCDEDEVYAYVSGEDASPRKFGFISAGGQILTKAEFDLKGFSGIRADLPMRIIKNGRHGYFGPHGTMLVEPQYEDSLDFFYDRHNYTAVKKNGAWAIMDKNGKLRTDFAFRASPHFAGGDLCLVELLNGRRTLWDVRENTIWAGNPALRPEESGHVKVEALGSSDPSQGRMAVRVWEWLPVEDGRGNKWHWKCYTGTGRELQGAAGCTTLGLRERIWAHDINGKWGAFDLSGNQVILFIYDEAVAANNSLTAYSPMDDVMRVSRDGKVFYVDKDGREYREGGNSKNLFQIY
jgi:hypothetical protein